jgi:hypothetical protein
MPSDATLPSGEIWLRQALSDLECAKLLETKPELRCHAVAKYQQTLEKGIKALAVAINDNTAAQITIRFNHDVETYINVMQHMPLSRNSNVPQRLRSLFNARDLSILHDLIAQAPRRSAPGENYARNTEYPFQNASREWISPCDEGVYSEDEIRMWARLTSKTVREITRLVDVLYRSKRQS